MTHPHLALPPAANAVRRARLAFLAVACGLVVAGCGGGGGGGGGSPSPSSPSPSNEPSPTPAQPADTTPPDVSITAPVVNAAVAGTTTITATASDDTGVVRVEFYVDGVLKGSDSTSPYAYSWDTTNGGTHPCNGVHTHSLTVRAYDAADNEGVSAVVSVNMSEPASCTATPAPGGSFVPPYTVPGAGQAVAIGANDFLDITPAEWSTGSWNYSVFGSYGGGTFVEDYSAGGAWAAAGTGGHAHPDNPGGVVFDFADATWKLIRPADPDATYQGPVGYPESDTEGAPYYEIVAAPGYPTPAHPYATLAPLPKAIGGGSQKGSVIYVTRHAIARESRSSGSAHQFDLATGTWSRVTAALSPRGSVEADAVYDAARKRYWYFTNSDHNYTSLLYLDANDWTWKTTASFGGWPPADMHAGRVHLYQGFIVRLTMNGLGAVDPDNPSAGWKKLNVAGSLPSSDRNRMALWRGKFYGLPNGGGNTLHRLTPPADPWNGTWVADTVTVGGAAIPAHAAHAMGVSHYTALFRVPALDLLAWVPGAGNAVYLIHP